MNSKIARYGTNPVCVNQAHWSENEDGQLFIKIRKQEDELLECKIDKSVIYKRKE